MPSFAKNFDLLHPLLLAGVKEITNQVNARLPEGTIVRAISGHRTPSEQFEIFKKGREFREGHWVATGGTYTNKNGFDFLSHHNYLPSLAVDFGMFKPGGTHETYIEDGNEYRLIGPIAESLGFEWGGRWTKPFDPGHVQVSINRLFGQSAVRGCAAVWQEMLKELGNYQYEVDGYFGSESSKALLSCVGETARSPEAYLKLLAKYRERVAALVAIPVAKALP